MRFRSVWILASLLASSGAAQDYAPLDQPGPALSIPLAELQASLNCSGDLALATRSPILLVHATAVTEEENWSWNYVPYFESIGWPFCTVSLPNHAMSDIQESAEYVVHAIREMHAESGRLIQVIGHSQGGHLPRWALRFWPDLRPRIDDLIAFAPPNHGTVVIPAMCEPDCAPAIWQQDFESDYVLAMNSHQQTFDEIDYTVIYTHADEFVQPNLDDTGVSSLAGGNNVSNIATQDICPSNTADHLSIGTLDPVAFAVAMDALTEPGPASTSRILLTVCAEAFMPGIDEATFLEDFSNAGSVLFDQLANYPHVPEEPPLKAYVFPEPAAFWSLALGSALLGLLARARRTP